MAHSLIAQASNSLLVRTISVTVVVMAFFGVATGALPVRCWIGGVCTTAGAPAAIGVAPAGDAQAPAPQPASADPARPVAVAAVATPANQTLVKSRPTLTNNDVIGATFAQLKVDFQAPTSLPNSPVKVATAAPFAAPAPLKPATGSAITSPDTGLTKRVVSTVSIRADGTPDIGGTVAEAYAAAPRTGSAAPSPALEAAARIGAGETPVAEVTPAVDLKPAAVDDIKPRAPTAATTPKSAMATVLGQGANVRSSPSKGGKVLFAINGGEKLTVLDDKRGWLRVKDDRGRVGWIYADGVRRS